MKKIETIDDLAEVMFRVYGISTLSNDEFCQSLISCAVSVHARTGHDDEAVLHMVCEAATNALAVVRARQTLAERDGAEVH